MSNLEEYIKQSFGQGVQKPQIEAELLKAGWTKDQIETVFYSVEFEQKQFIESHSKTLLPSKIFLNRIFKFSLKIIVIVIILTGLYLGIKYLTRPKPSIIATLKIDGDSDCVAKTNEALNLLKTRASDYYNDVVNNVNLIKCDKFSPNSIFTYNKGKKFRKFILNSNALDAGSIWLAGVITHETCHVQQYLEFEANRSSYSEKDWEGEKNRNLEGECDDVIYDALKKLGADQQTLEFAKNMR